MNKILRSVFCIVTAAAALVGCASIGWGHGPVESFAFLASANPQLPGGAIGAIDDSVEPKEIQVLVPRGTDMRGLVATFSFNKDAVVTAISSGTRVVQNNGVTPNDFSVPVTYAVEIVGEKKLWTYRVMVQEEQTNARLSMLAVPSGMILSPGFSPTVHAYALEVPFATRKVRIEARAQSPGLRSVTIDGTEIAGSSVVGSVDFQDVMARTITITTLAEDGVAQERYTLRIRRFRPPPPSAQDHPQPR
ncbi:MAG: cadherin-like beta sandwich domain-containing protein [Spirochaetia bacterium]